MTSLDALLAKIRAGWSPPPLEPAEELRRVRLILEALTARVVQLAEEQCPGVEAAISKFSRREEELCALVPGTAGGGGAS